MAFESFFEVGAVRADGAGVEGLSLLPGIWRGIKKELILQLPSKNKYIYIYIFCLRPYVP